MKPTDIEEYNSGSEIINKAQDGVAAITSAADMMLSSLDRINSVSSDVDDMVHTLADMRVAVKQIDAQLDAFKTATGTKLEKFKLQVPILDKQMDNISNRIDKITDKILALSDDDMSEATLHKQSLLMDALSQVNDTFNNIVMKLMEF